MSKRKIQISDEFALPLEAITGSIAILAQKGAGKTYTGGVLAEELHANGVPFTVVDPTGAHVGLRSGADGGPKGLPVVIFGGDTPDVPLQVDRGKEIATLLLKERLSAVLDLSLFQKPEAKRFVGEFSRQMYYECRSSYHIFFDECDWFVPQRMQHGDQACADAVADIVKLGRKRGLGSTLITQRAATANKDVLSQCDTLIALKTGHNLDVKQIDDWMEVHVDKEGRAKVLATIGSLPKGTAWIMSDGQPLQQVKIRKKRTFDSSKTPEPGTVVQGPKARAEVDLAALRERFADAIKLVEENDPERLRARIDELEALLASARQADKKVERVEIPAVTDEVRKDLNDALETLRRVAERVEEGLATAQSADVDARTLEARGVYANDYEEEPVPMEVPVQRDPVMDQGFRKAYGAPTRAKPNAEGKAPNLQPMLDMLAAIGPVTKEQLAAALGVSHTTGSFLAKIGAVQREGYATRDVHLRFALTEMGARKGSATRVRNFLPFWLSKVEPRQADMLKILASAGSKGLSKEELAHELGVSHTTGSFLGNVGRLAQLELAQRRSGRIVVGPQATRLR